MHASKRVQGRREDLFVAHAYSKKEAYRESEAHCSVLDSLRAGEENGAEKSHFSLPHSPRRQDTRTKPQTSEPVRRLVLRDEAQ